MDMVTAIEAEAKSQVEAMSSTMSSAIARLADRFRVSVTTDTSKKPSTTTKALESVMQIPELKEAIFLQLDICNLLRATSICKEWQDFIVSSPRLKDRLLNDYDPPSFQYAAALGQSQGRFGLDDRYEKLPTPGAWLIRIQQQAYLDGELIEGTLVILYSCNTHIKLPIWDDPEFQLPKGVRATLVDNKMLCWCSRHSESHEGDLEGVMLSEGEKSYFRKHFRGLLKDVADRRRIFPFDDFRAWAW